MTQVQGSNLLDVLKKKMRQTKEEMEKYKEESEDMGRKLQVEICRREEVSNRERELGARVNPVIAGISARISPRATWPDKANPSHTRMSEFYALSPFLKSTTLIISKSPLTSFSSRPPRSGCESSLVLPTRCQEHRMTGAIVSQT